eukprot:TRINITY_DN77168_c0_g1_i1.p1 TRINITY_DN77168_c0_g1~~TRINITY_DN77168_c0_g1_i1.p1  ORF type:complete len:409 (+),score=55.42 TRINITY_DN77168_c0_g1_i1:33-1229(+)
MSHATLESQWVEVDEELHFCWHRPPLTQVEAEAQDAETVRIFLNGCFDLMHVGHFNALRQAKSLFIQRGFKKVVMVAGIHSDAAIARQKGPPMMTDEERIAVLRATKWVDEIVTALPYVSMSAKMADILHVQWICHGDDMPVCKGGGGMYSDAIEKERFQLLKRTEGISTTQIVERLLERDGASSREGSEVKSLDSVLATTQRLTQFALPSDPLQSQKLLSSAQRVVYVPGTFDLMHPGHVGLLEQAAKLGDYVLVGLYSDETVLRYRGALPILTLHERAMSLLSMRWVNDVVLGAPWEVTPELLTTMNISCVVVGTRPPASEGENMSREVKKARITDPLAYAQKLGIVREVSRTHDLSMEKLKHRFKSRSDEFAQRNSTLLQKELRYIESKAYVPES